MLMSLTPRITPGMTRKVAAACGAGVLLIGATACGSSSSSTAQAQGYTQNGQNGRAGQTGRGFPGADGKVAAVSGSTAQVQSQTSGQVAVTWTSATTFTQQVSAALKDVKVGECVMVQPVSDATTSGGSTSTTPPTAVTAATVRITAKSGGSCTAGFGGAGGPQFNGNGPGGAAPQPPPGTEGGQGVPGGMPPGGAAGGGPQFRSLGAFGEITAVSGSGFTLRSTRPVVGSTTATTTAVAVTVSSATTYTTTTTGKAADVIIGSCVRATGTTDSTGAVTAKAIAISPATNGTCGSLTFRGGSGGGSTTALGS